MKSKTKKVEVPKPKTYAEVLQLSQQNEMFNPTMTEKWLIGCYKHYQKQLLMDEDKLVAEKWWSGCIKSYNERICKEWYK